MSKIDLSIIVPCYNEGPTFTKSAYKIIRELKKINLGWEIIFVEDKSQDNTKSAVENLIKKIESENPPTGTLLIFDDSSISTSSEAYFALGTGKALEFWFARKNYKTCFSAFENCPSNN